MSGPEDAPQVRQLGIAEGRAGNEGDVHGVQRFGELFKVFPGNILVEIIGGGARQSPFFKFREQTVKDLVLHKQPVKIAGIEDVPVEAGGHHKTAELRGLSRRLILAVVIDELLESLAVEVARGQHLDGVFIALHLHQYTHGRGGRVAEVQHQVAVPFAVYVANGRVCV